MAGLRVHFVFPAGLVERVDAALTVGQSRGEFVRVAVEQALGQRTSRTGVPDSPSSTGVASPAIPAPAEQPSRPLPHYNERDALPPAKSQTFPPEFVPSREFTRTSVQAKRDVRPVPKAKP